MRLASDVVRRRYPGGRGPRPISLSTGMPIQYGFIVAHLPDGKRILLPCFAMTRARFIVMSLKLRTL